MRSYFRSSMHKAQPLTLCLLHLCYSLCVLCPRSLPQAVGLRTDSFTWTWSRCPGTLSQAHWTSAALTSSRVRSPGSDLEVTRWQLPPCDEQLAVADQAVCF
jgi:hypothetical protein